jgi:hypothetical protein
MAINFPDSPATNDSFTSGGKKWIFDGTVWSLITANSYTIPTGEITTAKILDANVTAAKLASGAAVTNIGYTPANIAGPTFTGTVVLPSTTSIGTVSSTEIGYVDGVTSAIQTQLNSKLTATTDVTSNRNAVINGSFGVWQRSTDATTVGGYGYASADRWISRTAAGGGSVKVSRQATSDTTNLPNIRYCARVQRTASNTDTGPLQIIHTLETANSIPFAGKTVTLSFYARKGANYSPTSSGMNPQLYSGTGTDQHWTSFTSQSTAIAQTVALSATWQRFSYSATIASTATQLYMIFEMVPTGTAGANDYFEITGVQLEAGAVATPFESEDFGTTLAKCQRYFEKSYNIGTTPGTASTLDESIGLGIYTNTPAAYNRIGSGVFFKVPKRATPTVVQYAPATGSTAAASNATNGDGSTAVGYVSAQQINQNGFNIAASIGGSTSTGYFTIFYAYTASAEL